MVNYNFGNSTADFRLETGNPRTVPRKRVLMKADIHPRYEEVKVTCSCGNAFTTRGTKSEIAVELCDQCHPFYTGTQKLVDTGGRVERFNKRYGTRKNAKPEETATSES